MIARKDCAEQTVTRRCFARVLKWIVERAEGRALVEESALGWMPRYEDLDWRGLEDFTSAKFEEVMAVDAPLWKRELLSHEELFVELFDRLPKEFEAVRSLMLSGLWRLRANWGIEHSSVGS